MMKIKQESGIYKLVNKMSVTFPFAIYMGKEWDNEHPSSFNDVCTFVRHLLLTLFIIIPIILILGLMLLAVAFMMFIYIPYQAIVTDNWAGYIMLILYGVWSVSYVVLLALQSKYGERQKISNDTLDNDKQSTLSQILDIIKEKNSKICKKIDIE